MLRHLKNFNELALYAGLSCAVAWLVRLNPILFYPVLFLRIGILGYCFYVIGCLEEKRPIAVLIGIALFLGWLGGYWDLIEVNIHHNLTGILAQLTMIIAIPMIATALYLGVRNAEIKQ